MRRGRERGSTLLEAALIFPVLMAVLLGAVDVSRSLMASNFVSYAAKEATRYAEVRGADSRTPATAESVANYVRGMALGVAPGDLRVTTIWTPDNRPGSRVRVEVAAGELKAGSEVVVLR